MEIFKYFTELVLLDLKVIKKKILTLALMMKIDKSETLDWHF